VSTPVSPFYAESSRHDLVLSPSGAWKRRWCDGPASESIGGIATRLYCAMQGVRPDRQDLVSGSVTTIRQSISGDRMIPTVADERPSGHGQNDETPAEVCTPGSSDIGPDGYGRGSRRFWVPAASPGRRHDRPLAGSGAARCRRTRHEEGCPAR